MLWLSQFNQENKIDPGNRKAEDLPIIKFIKETHIDHSVIIISIMLDNYFACPERPSTFKYLEIYWRFEWNFCADFFCCCG